MEEKYIPEVPYYVAKILDTKRHNGYKYVFDCGYDHKGNSLKDKFKTWKHHYSRKYKYALLNGYTVEKSVWDW